MKQKGFSLLELIVAMGILSISIAVISDLYMTSMRRSLRAERMTQATMLVRLKMNEMRLELEKQISKGEFPSDNKHEEGTFDEPFEEYQWEADIKKVEIPVPPPPEGEDQDQGMAMMLTVFKMISEKIAESAREITIKVKWQEMEDEQSLSAATHIVRL